MNEVKFIILKILTGRNSLTDSQLRYLFITLLLASKLIDKSNIDEEYLVEFTNQSIKLFRSGNYDDWINLFKNELITIENYSLIIELGL